MFAWFLNNSEKVTFCIAAAGFIMSLATWIKDLVSQRKNIKGKILNIKSDKNLTVISLLVENRSRLPIAISQIILHLSEAKYPCTPLPVLVCEHTKERRGEVYERRMEYSTQLPIQIEGLGATTACVLFDQMKQLPSDHAKTVTLSIGTNRGKIAQMTLELPAGWASQRKNW